MQKEIGLTEARSKLSKIVNSVMYQRDTFIISKQGKPAAALVPLEVLERWQAERRKLFEVIREVQEQNEDADPDEVMAAVLEAQAVVRAEQPNG